MPRPTVALVRHPTTAWSGVRYGGRSDPPLDRAGLAATRTIAESLAGSVGPWCRIVSSPLQRALVTATAISDLTGAPLEVDERWQEADFGAVEGCTFADIEERWPDLARRLASGEPAIDWPGGEPAAELEARVRVAWQDLADDARPTVVVAHAGPLRVALGLSSGRPTASMWLPEPSSIVWVPGPVAVGPGLVPAGAPEARATLGR